MTGEELPPNQKASRPRRLDAAPQHQAGPFPRSVSGACLSSALLTNSTESIAAPSWVTKLLDRFLHRRRQISPPLPRQYLRTKRYQTSVPEWDRQFRLVRVHHEHREELGRLRLAGIGADAVAAARAPAGTPARPCGRPPRAS